LFIAGVDELGKKAHFERICFDAHVGKPPVFVTDFPLTEEM
jgi:hypothetical protein